MYVLFWKRFGSRIVTVSYVHFCLRETHIYDCKCPVYLMLHCFLLLFLLCFLGSPTIGILKHKEKFYAFNSKESAYIFAQNPDKFIQLIIEKAKENAELIQLLELHHQFESLAPYTQVVTACTLCLKR